MICANFDAGLKAELQQDEYQVLIATDAISEGYNLHRAGAIFNYDIPYNPTRVIQRIGRINRINKKVFNHLYIYNYFPTDVGESEGQPRPFATAEKLLCFWSKVRKPVLGGKRTVPESWMNPDTMGLLSC